MTDLRIVFGQGRGGFDLDLHNLESMSREDLTDIVWTLDTIREDILKIRERVA